MSLISLFSFFLTTTFVRRSVVPPKKTEASIGIQPPALLPQCPPAVLRNWLFRRFRSPRHSPPTKIPGFD